MDFIDIILLAIITGLAVILIRGLFIHYEDEHRHYYDISYYAPHKHHKRRSKNTKASRAKVLKFTDTWMSNI